MICTHPKQKVVLNTKSSLRSTYSTMQDILFYSRRRSLNCNIRHFKTRETNHEHSIDTENIEKNVALELSAFLKIKNESNGT